MADKLKALPNLSTDRAIADIRTAIREIDVNSITALKDLTKAFQSQKRRIDSLEREVKTAESNISDIEAAVEQNTSELFTIQTIQNKILTQIENLQQAFTTEISSLDKKIEKETRDLNDSIKDLAGRINQSGGGDLLSSAAAGAAGAAATRSAPAAEAAVAKKTLASMVPALVKGTMRVIGGAIATFATTIVSSLAEATGHPQVAAGADIIGDTILGASLGSAIGSIVPGVGTAVGSVVGGALGAGYGAYEKGGQLLGTAEISPQIRELQQQADERTANRQAEESRIERLHQEKPELKFEGGKVPDVVAPQPNQNVEAANIPKTLQERTNVGFRVAQEEFLKAGYTPEAAKAAAAGLIGNAIQESNLNPSLSHDNNTGYGLFGHRDPPNGGYQRRTALFEHMAKAGKARNDFEEQIRFGVQELVSRYGELNTELKRNNDARTAANLIAKKYEVPLPATANYSGRMANAAGVLSTVASSPDAGKVGQAPTVTPPSGGESGKTPSGATPMGQTPVTSGTGTSGGPPSNDIVALGKWLQSQGIRVSEHPSFGGVHPGAHHPHSAHNDGMAIDINGSGIADDSKDPVWGPKFDKLAAQLNSAGYTVLWKTKDHFNHIHAQIGGKGIKGGHSIIGGQSLGEIPKQATEGQTPGYQPPSSAPQAPSMAQAPVTPPPMGGAIGSSGIAGMQAQLMGNPMMMLSGMGIGGGMAGLVAGMLTPVLMNALSPPGPNMMSAQLQQQAPQSAQLIPPAIQEAPIKPYDEGGEADAKQSVNNINVMGGQGQKEASVGMAQNQVHMNARPDWLGSLAEGLLGATYTGMSRPKYFGAGTGKM